MQALGRVSRFFLASWNGKYLPSADASAAPPPLNSAPAETPATARAEVKHMPSTDAPRPFALISPPARPSVVSEFTESVPKFSVASSESLEPNRFSTVPPSASESAAEHALIIAEARQTLASQQAEFAQRLAKQLDSFNRQIALQLENISGQVIQRFSEELNAHAGHALNALMSDWAEQNRALVDAECNRHLDQFSAHLQSLSTAHLEIYRKEMQNLSSNLKNRLRGVAHALQDVGPASHRS